MLSSRDEMLVTTVRRLGYVSRVGLERRFFQSERTAQRVLARLTERGHLRRTKRLGPAIYHIERWEAQAEHRAAVSDAILLLRPERWKLEVPVVGTRAKADALLRRGDRLLWLEVEHRSHGKALTKIAAYRESCRRKKWTSLFSEFPDLLILGLGPRAEQAARQAMQGERAFHLYLSIEEAQGWGSQR